MLKALLESTTICLFSNTIDKVNRNLILNKNKDYVAKKWSDNERREIIKNIKKVSKDKFDTVVEDYLKSNESYFRGVKKQLDDQSNNSVSYWGSMVKAFFKNTPTDYLISEINRINSGGGEKAQIETNIAKQIRNYLTLHYEHGFGKFIFDKKIAILVDSDMVSEEVKSSDNSSAKQANP